MESTKREEEREGGKGVNTSQNREVNIDQYLLKRTVDSKSQNSRRSENKKKTAGNE